MLRELDPMGIDIDGGEIEDPKYNDRIFTDAGMRRVTKSVPVFSFQPTRVAMESTKLQQGADQ